MQKSRVVFVPGTGPSGAQAWPRQHGLSLDFDALFLKAAPSDYSWEQRKAAVASALEDGGHLVAHAEGAADAMYVALEHPELVSSLALFEPACLSLTAELPATAAYLSAHSKDELRPWEAPVHIVPGVPTLVITGGWEPVFEEVAQYLVGTGAVHRTTPGAHRPQDSVEAAGLLKSFLRKQSPR
ncbi:alpha/beta fold hydrolase [Pseudarthrobacter sp. J1738]|uniref:alpha/beta fold hydrolase n=1 Tax=unclassified Pseudarthrobacter TaxID=2647000 RepID=UPI003D2D2D0D